MKKMRILGMLFLVVFLCSGALQAQDDRKQVSNPATQSLPQVKTYEELRHAISQARAGSRLRVEQAVEKERVREAWEIGRLIDAHVLQHKERADYGMQVLERLAKDLAMDRSELYRMLEFYRTYPIVVPARQLSWSHYKALIAVNDPEKREVLAEKAEKEGWKRDRLREEIRNVTQNGNAAPEEVLTAEPGKPGTYRVILAKAGPYAGKLAIDLGFSNYYLPPGTFSFKEGDIVELQTAGGRLQTADERLQEKDSSALRHPPSDLLYTYHAYVYKVLDGDTVNAVVDLGFGFVTTQTLRLRGIDAPELVTADGREAKKALEKMLEMQDGGGRMADGETSGRRMVDGKAGPVIANPVGVKQSQNDGIATSQFSVKNLRRIGTAMDSNIEINDIQTTKPPVLIKTVKSDKYDRYLADIFIDHTYVNQKLVDKGLAVIVEE
jgi:endonuclease YncB( thermonuclease family)